jgi:DNA-cytosine methyltransferase
VTMKNFPDTIQLGNVTQVKGENIPVDIDLLIGGSPCQGFSFAGKQLNFDDPRSKLFFEFVRLKEELNPKYFMLENVKMKKEYQDVITKYLGVKPIEINSSLVSAQNRKRLYWTNIKGVLPPENKRIVLKDILEENAPSEFYLSDMAIDYMSRLRNGKPRFEYHTNPLDGKAACLTANMFKGVPYGVLKDSLCVQIGEASEINGHDILKRVYDINFKSPTLNACTGGNREPKISEVPMRWRKLTPVECERLQTVPDNYTDCVSKTQRYKMLGNGWTVDVVAHIFSFMK